MRGNQQFPVAVHALALVGLSQQLENEMPSSTAIARSVNTNPVVIRRINGLLKVAGLIEISQGVTGIGLAKDPKEVTLREVFRAVQSPNVFDLHHNTNPECVIGSVINDVMSEPLLSAQKALEDELDTYVLYDVMQGIAERNGVKI